MSKYAIGMDFGTNSCRAVLVDIADGRELASKVFLYPSGDYGVIVDPSDPHLARQNPADYVQGIEHTIKEVVREAHRAEPHFSPTSIIGIGVDTTGSSPMPVDANGIPLCFHDRFKHNPAAMVWLWKDHTSFAEAEAITQLAEKLRPHYLAKIGGTYSSEWFWSKILHCRLTAPDVYDAAHSFVEIADWIPALLTGNMKPELIKRGICAAGHKAMYNEDWNGLPDSEFLEELCAGLGDLRSRLYDTVYPTQYPAGCLSPEWAQRLGLSTNVVVSVGGFDAHIGAVGAGIKTGTLVKILGTSTCDIMVYPNDKPISDIPGVCGIVNGSVLDGYYGIEAGQSAVGDMFLWFVKYFVPDKYGKTPDDKFRSMERAASQLRPGETGLLALDWSNGNRTILVDARLTGLLVGHTLHSQPHEIYRALIESTAFGALRIIDRIEEYGIKINDIINCGGLATKSPLLLQLYADITGRPMKVSRSEQTPALGAALFAAVAAGPERGGYPSVEEAQRAMTGWDKLFSPNEEHHLVYKRLYSLYCQLHDGFGTREHSCSMYNVMKELLNLRDSVRGETECSNS